MLHDFICQCGADADSLKSEHLLFLQSIALEHTREKSTTRLRKSRTCLSLGSYTTSPMINLGARLNKERKKKWSVLQSRLEPVSPETQATNAHFQNYQEWSRFNGNYKNRKTSIFWLMVLSTNIDAACIQIFRAVSGTNDAGCWWHDGDNAVSNTEQSCYQGFFLLLFFTIRPHLDHVNNQKPKYGWYKGSNLEGLKMSDFSWFGPIQRRNRFWAQTVPV